MSQAGNASQLSVVPKAFQVPFTALQVARVALQQRVDLFNHPALNLPQSAQQPLRWLRMKKVMSFVTTTWSENIRVSEKQPPFLTLEHIPSPFRTIGTTGSRTELIQKKKFKFQK